MQTLTRTVLSETKNESKSLAGQLSKEIQELREVNKELSEASKTLEIKIAGLVASADAAKTATAVVDKK